MSRDVAHRWFQGPEFLRQELEPEGKMQPEFNLEGNPEVRCAVTIHSTSIKVDSVNDLIKRSLSWTKIQRIDAWILRYKAIIPTRIRGQVPPHSSEQLTINELKAAEKAVIRHVQSQEYNQKCRT